VPKADVVVTNPTHIAVAIRYDREKGNAPIVVAKGAGHVAEKIREIARKHGVPILENKPLARTLHKTVKVGMEIPANLYKAVAEVLAYVYRLKQKRK
jgi:flagellar biosynthetic protein FlhB